MNQWLTSNRTLLGLLAILLLAAFLRFWQLGELPPGLYHDEAYNGLDALSLTQAKTFPQFYEGWELYAQDAHAERPPNETRWPLFFEGNYGREPLHVYLMALSIGLLGATPTAIRAVPALAGVVAVLTTWWAAKALTRDKRPSVARLETRDAPSPISLAQRANLIPLIAAFTLAILYPAIHFSRFGIRAMVFVPVETLAVGCFWRGIHSAEIDNRPSLHTFAWFVAAGGFLGLGIYTFAAARLLPLLWVLFVPLWFWLDRAALRRFWKPVAAMAAAALLTALPLLTFFWRYPYFFLFRIAYVANKGAGAVEGKPWLTWLLNLGRVVRGIFWQGETHLRHNLPGRPFLDAVQASFLVIGLVATARRVLQPRALFLLLWLGVMLLPTILSGDAPHFGRMMGSAAPLAILVAIGAVAVANWLAERTGRKTVAYGLLALAMALSLGLTVRDYFGSYASHPDLARDFYLDEWKMGQFAAEFPADATISLTPTQEELATIYFALQDPARLRNYEGSQGAIPAGVAGKTSVYLTRPSDPASLQALQTAFPYGVVGEPQPGFVPFVVAADAERNRAANAIDHAFDDRLALVGWELTASDSAETWDVQLVWQKTNSAEVDSLTAFVHLINEAGEVAAQLDRPPGGYPTSDWRTDEIVIDTYTLDVADLPPGTYRLTTGFYDPATLVRLGEAAELVEITID